jgi:hypothetical protein
MVVKAYYVSCLHRTDEVYLPVPQSGFMASSTELGWSPD